MAQRDQIRKGSTDFVILSLLARRPMYGYEISQSLERNGGYFEMKEGLLYPALHRMQEKGWLTTEWRVVEGRRRKYYTLTRQGQEVLGEQAAEWKTFLEQLHAVIGSNELGDRMTIDEVLMNISIHLHLSKESEHEILAEIRSHLEDAVADAKSRGLDEQAALQKVAEQFGIEEAGAEIQAVHANWEAVDAIFVTALPVLFAVALRWLTYSPDGTTRNWQLLLVQPGFYLLALAALILPFLILHRWRYALIGWGIFWFLTIIFVIFPSIQHW